jgi:hypothetical protein
VPLKTIGQIAGQVATLQLAAAKTYGLIEIGEQRRLLVLLGFWPNADGSEEFFAVSRPGGELAPFMHKLAALTRLILSWRLQSGTRSIVGLVRSENEAGHRLARIGGFTVVSHDPMPAGFVKYELRTASGRCSSGGARKGFA